MQYGLKQSTIDSIHEVLLKYPAIEKVMLYGSRAKGTYRNVSDIDLSIKGDQFNQEDLFRIENELDDLLLPHYIDLSIYNQIKNEDLIEHINRIGIVFYTR